MALNSKAPKVLDLEDWNIPEDGTGYGDGYGCGTGAGWGPGYGDGDGSGSGSGTSCANR